MALRERGRMDLAWRRRSWHVRSYTATSNIRASDTRAVMSGVTTGEGLDEDSYYLGARRGRIRRRGAGSLGSDTVDQAMVAVDIATLSRIFADDWTSIGASGAVVTKEKMLSNFKSGAHRLEAFELGPMDVQVKGNVAVVHGGVAETRTNAGKDASGEYVWMDLMEKRNGTWVVIRSAGAKVR
jgi:ketosteroid isomerase-like protein